MALKRFWRAVCLAMTCAALLQGTSPTFDIRLQSALTSYASDTGDLFSAVALSEFQPNGQLLIPAGSIIRGRVRHTRSVGVGLVHERAMLDLDFYEYVLPDGRTIPFTAQVFG